MTRNNFIFVTSDVFGNSAEVALWKHSNTYRGEFYRHVKLTHASANRLRELGYNPEINLAASYFPDGCLLDKGPWFCVHYQRVRPLLGSS